MFKLPAELTIAHVEECKNQIILLIDQSQNISIDDSDVMRIDTVGIQLLLAIVTYISLQNKTLAWQLNSSVIRNGISQLGLDDSILHQYFVA